MYERLCAQVQRRQRVLDGIDLELSHRYPHPERFEILAFSRGGNHSCQE